MNDTKAQNFSYQVMMPLVFGGLATVITFLLSPVCACAVAIIPIGGIWWLGRGWGKGVIRWIAILLLLASAYFSIRLSVF